MAGINDFVPEIGERMFIAGQSGSGKTYFLERVVSATPERHKVILDVKAEFDTSLLPGIHVAKTPQEVSLAGTMGKAHIVYQPHTKIMRDSGAWEDVLAWIYNRGNTEVIIDEMYGLANPDSRLKFPDSLFTIITRGRSRGVTGYFGSQRPCWVPLECISESQHTVCFRLKLPADRKRMAEATGEPVFQQVISRLIPAGKGTGHEFLYHNQNMEHPQMFCIE